MPRVFPFNIHRSVLKHLSSVKKNHKCQRRKNTCIMGSGVVSFDSGIHTGVDGCWCTPRSSKPVIGVSSFLGGFDSHARPPIFLPHKIIRFCGVPFYLNRFCRTAGEGVTRRPSSKSKRACAKAHALISYFPAGFSSCETLSDKYLTALLRIDISSCILPITERRFTWP